MDYIQALLGLLCISAIKFLDLADESTIFFVRCAYATGTLLTFVALGLIYTKIQAAADKQELVITQGDLNPPPPLAGMLGAPQAPSVGRGRRGEEKNKKRIAGKG